MPSRRNHGTGSPLTANHALIQALNASFLLLPPKSLGGMTRFHNKVMGMPKRLRAAHFREFMPEESDQEIADMVGVDRSTLYTWPEYMAAKAKLKRDYPPQCRGFKDEDGTIEAW